MHVSHIIKKLLQGTPPFIAIELLIHGCRHRLVHDLESLFFVLLFICTHLDGPQNSIANPPLLGKAEHPSPIQKWLTMPNLQTLGYVKFGSMLGHFEEGVLSHISPYFYPLKPHILSWWRVLHPVTATVDAAKTHFSSYHDPSPSKIIDVFKQALMDPLVKEGNDDKSALKCSFPGERTQDGWDVVPATNAHPPELGTMKKRRRNLMTKRHNRG